MKIHPGAFKFTQEQITSIIDKTVPLVAAEEDYDFFKGVLLCYADSCSSAAQFSTFIVKMLKATS